MGNIVNFWSRYRSRHHPDDAFEAAIRPYIRLLYRLAVHYCGNTEEAEELVQELICRLYARQQDVLAIDNLKPWLTRVLYNLFVDRFRRDQLRPASFSELALTDESANEAYLEPETGDEPEREFERTLTRERLQSALHELPPAQRILLIMHDVEDYTLPELEAVLEVPIGTLKSRLHRGRERLRQILLQKDATFSGRYPLKTVRGHNDDTV